MFGASLILLPLIATSVYIQTQQKFFPADITDLTLTPMCIKHCILSTLPSSIKKKPTGNSLGWDWTHDLCIARADV